MNEVFLKTGLIRRGENWVAIAVIYVLCLGAPTTVNAGNAFGRYHAIVIGINDYLHMPKLDTAVNDAMAVHTLIQERFGFKSELMINPN